MSTLREDMATVVAASQATRKAYGEEERTVTVSVKRKRKARLGSQDMDANEGQRCVVQSRGSSSCAVRSWSYGLATVPPKLPRLRHPRLVRPKTLRLLPPSCCLAIYTAHTRGCMRNPVQMSWQP